MHERVYQIIDNLGGELVAGYRGFRLPGKKPFKSSLAFEFEAPEHAVLAGRRIVAGFEKVPRGLSMGTFTLQYRSISEGDVTRPSLVLFGDHAETRIFLARLKQHALEQKGRQV